jgi:hypothetical protein
MVAGVRVSYWLDIRGSWFKLHKTNGKQKPNAGKDGSDLMSIRLQVTIYVLQSVSA